MIKSAFDENGEDLQKIIEMFLVDFYYEYYELNETKSL